MRLAARCLLLCLLCTCRGGHWAIEQPGSSTFVHYPYLKFLQRVMKNFVNVQIHRLFFPELDLARSWLFRRSIQPLSHPQASCRLSWMAWFGSKTPKASILIGTPLQPQTESASLQSFTCTEVVRWCLVKVLGKKAVPKADQSRQGKA